MLLPIIEYEKLLLLAWFASVMLIQKSTWQTFWLNPWLMMTFTSWQNLFCLSIQGRHNYRWKLPRLKLWHFPSIWKIWHSNMLPLCLCFKNYTCILLLFAVTFFLIEVNSMGGYKIRFTKLSSNFNPLLILFWQVLISVQTYPTPLFLRSILWLHNHDGIYDHALWHFIRAGSINDDNQFVTISMSSQVQPFNRKLACEDDSCLIFGVVPNQTIWLVDQKQNKNTIVQRLPDWILSDVAGRLGLDGAQDEPERKFESEEAELDCIQTPTVDSRT